MIQGLKKLKMDASVRLTENISEADALLALHSKLKKNSGIQSAAKSHDIPVYLAKVNAFFLVSIGCTFTSSKFWYESLFSNLFL